MKKTYLKRFSDWMTEAQLSGRDIKPEQLPYHMLPNHEVYLCGVALEAKFGREFTEKEVKRLLKQELNYNAESLEEQGETLIPQWYKDKWFKS